MYFNDIHIVDYQSHFPTKHNQPSYVEPEKTGDELLDEIFEVQALRTYKKELAEYDERTKSNKELVSRLLTASVEARRLHKLMEENAKLLLRD